MTKWVAFAPEEEEARIADCTGLPASPDAYTLRTVVSLVGASVFTICGAWPGIATVYRAVKSPRGRS